MKKMTSGELRSMWLNFFKSKGHAVIPSASVIPENDPTVLFTTAGMHPLVPYLLGKIHFFKKITWLYATLGIALLSTVLILGEVTHGSKISFSLGGITFQPSEFVKILFLFFLAGPMDRKLERIKKKYGIL